MKSRPIRYVLQNLRRKNEISRQIFETVEEEFALSLGARRRGGQTRWALCKRAIYLGYLTGLHLSEIISPNIFALSQERHKVGEDQLDIVYIRMNSEKILTMPVFLDNMIDRSDNRVVYFEHEMWDVITDSWSKDEPRINFNALGNYQNANTILQRALNKTSLLIRGTLDKPEKVPLKFNYLRPLRIYDLLRNKREYGINTDSVAAMLGMPNSRSLVKSIPYQEAFKGIHTLDLLQ